MNKQIKLNLLGSDPEVFLAERETGRVVSAIPYVMGDKYNPYQIPRLPEGCMIQTDNVMVEYCLPPTLNPIEFYNNFRACVEWTESIIPAELQVVIKASARLDEEFLQDPQAKRFGCEPDFNAWLEGTRNQSPSNKTNLRTAGGHLHVSYEEPDYEDRLDLIKSLDIFLGIPSIILDPDKERKKMYGKAGAMRFKSWGVEYRSLSNFWLGSLELVQSAFKGVEMAVEFYNSGKIAKLTDEDQLSIQTCINTGDEALALQLVHKYQLESILNKAEVFID